MTTTMDGRRVFGAAAMLLALAGCGGSDPTIDNANQGCSVTEQKSWLRSYMRDWYYWSGTSPDPAPGPEASETVADYFDALLLPGEGRTDLTQHWSYISDTASYNQFFGDGKTLGYGVSVNGVELRALYEAGQPLTPLKIRFVDASSPAAGRLTRGDTVISINGVSAADFIAANDYSALSANKAGDAVTLVVDRGAGPTTVVLSATVYSLVPVSGVQTLTLSNDHKAGYLALKEFVSQAEQPLRDAFARFTRDGATELILDLRYNGGGSILTSATLGGLVAGVSNNGKTFASLIFNAKHQSANRTFPLTDGTATAYSRVVVLTGSRTCSASELIVNGLKPYATVVTIGGTSCGKPFGFQPRENCKSTYSAVNFESFNAAGNGRYYDGIAATCPATDDFTGVMGNPAEKLTAAAVRYLQTDACPSTGTGRQSPLSLPRSRSGRTTEPGERQGMFAN